MDSHKFLQSFCGDILQCQKNTALYPRSHPRVVAASRELVENVRVHQQESGTAFTLETIAVEDFSAALDPPANAVYISLARLLKLHPIEKTTIQSGVPTDELFELCCLLGEDFLRFSTKSNRELFDPSLWEFVWYTY